VLRSLATISTPLTPVDGCDNYSLVLDWPPPLPVEDPWPPPQPPEWCEEPQLDEHETEQQENEQQENRLSKKQNIDLLPPNKDDDSNRLDTGQSN
jgi:hypothetical protein